MLIAFDQDLSQSAQKTCRQWALTSQVLVRLRERIGPRQESKA